MFGRATITLGIGPHSSFGLVNKSPVGHSSSTGCLYDITVNQLESGCRSVANEVCYSSRVCDDVV